MQQALSHQTITLTMRYSHLAPDHLRAAVAVLDGFLSFPRQSPPTFQRKDQRKGLSQSALSWPRSSLET
jgi:hypothetical protein